MKIPIPGRPAWRTILLILGLMNASCSKGQHTGGVSVPGSVAAWITTADRQMLFEAAGSLPAAAPAEGPVIRIDTSLQYQSIDGFGYCLTGGSAMLIHRLPDARRQALLKELFDTLGQDIGISYLRVSIGASDLDPQVFSYDDLGPGETDTALTHFSLGPDLQDLVPLLKEILAINPTLKILGSPWSAPPWMKTNGSSAGGKLRPDYYGVYARYIVRYLQAMADHGISIDAITPQNEPLNPKNNPSMVMEATEQRDFIRDALGPALRAAGLDTRIIVYDHNCDRPDYPLTILADSAASAYVDGSAFHMYGGDISAMSKVHEAYPEKNVYFTEQWTGGPGHFGEDLRWHVRTLIIGATRNWSRTVLEWNLAADPEYQPHTPGGCTSCMGALTIGEDITRNVSYYIIAHAAKFVRPGSLRLASNEPEHLPNVAFRTPVGQRVLIVLNDSGQPLSFVVDDGRQRAQARLDAGAVGTYVWP